MRHATLIATALLTLGAACTGAAPADDAAATATRAARTPAQIDSLLATPIPEARRAQLEDDLRRAQQALADDSSDADRWIWVGRRQAYLGDYRGAIATFTAAMARFPDDARLWRHRGHRYITLREFDRAIPDFAAAADRFAGQPDAVEPDGQPNARGIPTSTLQFNTWYHLGLAHHLRGEWGDALSAYERCLGVSTNPDALVATTYWLYLTARRAGDEARAQRALAAVADLPEVIENTAYQQLLRYFAGALPREAVVPAEGDAVQDATLAYGLALFDLLEGRDTTAAAFRRIVDGAGSRAAFGYIAAEAELARR